MKSKVVGPESPSSAETSETERSIAEGQGLSGEAVFRGVGSPAAKSAALSSVSVQPFALRSAAVVFESVGAGPEPSKKFAPP